MQRTVIKHSYLKQSKLSKKKAVAHIRYLAFRPGKEKKKERRFFTEREDAVSTKQILKQLEKVRYRGVLIHKLIISPGNNDIEIIPFTRHLMSEISKRKGQQLDYKAVAHNNTEHNHAHVIVFGKDLDGMRVRFTKYDHDFLREVGDRYIEKRLDPPEPWPKKSAQKLLRGLLQSVLNKRAAAPEEHAAIEERIGILPTPKERLKAWVKQKARELRSRGWMTKPISISKSSAVVEEFDQNSDKQSLIELREDCRRGFYKDQISKMELRKLDSWIETWNHWEARTKTVESMHYAKARKVTAITVAADAGTTKTFSQQSSLEELKELANQTAKGEVALPPVEEKALEIWLKDKSRKQPIRLDMGESNESLIYRMEDPIDSLRLLARIAKPALEPDEYKRLWYWIFQRERELETAHDKNNPVVIKTELGDLEYTRQDCREHLFMLLDGYKHKAKWAIDNMKEKDVKKVKEWLTKDEPEI